MVEDEPEIFSPVPKGWGRMGATRVCLKKVPRDILAAALRTAWQRRAPEASLRPNSLQRVASNRKLDGSLWLRRLGIDFDP